MDPWNPLWYPEVVQEQSNQPTKTWVGVQVARDTPGVRRWVGRQLGVLGAAWISRGSEWSREVRAGTDARRPPAHCPPAGAPSQRWSMQLPAEVRAVAGEAAVLPCTFTHPHGRYDGPLTAIWRTGEPFAGPQVFRCAVARGAELCRTALSLHGRFHLLGRPRRNDLSLRVERLGPDDDGRYFCRVELAGDVHDRYESRQGVWLRVNGEGQRGTGTEGCWALCGRSVGPSSPPFRTAPGDSQGKLPMGTERGLSPRAEFAPLPGIAWPGPPSTDKENPLPGRAGGGVRNGHCNAAPTR